MENVNELWQAEVNGQIYEASFEDLAQWIGEGALLPNDKVRRGNLRWIEAQKVPALYGYFNAVTLGVSQPIVQTTDAAQPQNDLLEGINCVLHTETEAKFYCETCINYFCYDCPKTAGGLSNCCPFCGAICRSLQKTEEEPAALVIETNVAEAQPVPPEIAHAAHKTVRDQATSVTRTGTSVTTQKSGIGGFILSVFVALLLSAGGAYLWSFQFAKPDEAAEKKIAEVVVLEEKYNTEKQGVRLQFMNSATNPAGETLEQAQSKLKVKFDGERAAVIENYRNNQAWSSFYMIGGIAFAVMFFGLILIKASSSKR
jgi:hypothetical protein